MRGALASVVVLCGFLASCGARTGLDEGRDAAGLDAPRLDALVRDAPGDAPDTPLSVDAPFDARDAPPPDGCRIVTVALTPITAEVLLVLDRSTSMSWALTGSGGPGPSRWSILGDALRTELPRYDASSDLGLLFFPEPGGAICGTRTSPTLAPAADASRAVLGAVAGAMPGGRTPTTAAMTTAHDYFVTHRDPGRPQAVVLATDGAPNCNGALDVRTCRCSVPGRCTEAELCLDDTRAIAVTTDLLALGVPTYVIGIDGDPDPTLSSVLTRLAVAGGRPNPLDLARGYYSVRRAEDLGAALERIEASIARCTLRVEGSVPEGRPFVVTLDGAVVPEDPTRTDGWTWGADGSGLVELHGATCDLAQDGAEHVLELVAGC